MARFHIRNPGKFIVIVILFLIIMSAGMATGAFDTIVKFSKAFIYCQGAVEKHGSGTPAEKQQ